jgi:F-type H+-transporting ATPase subunit epsilon
MADTKHLQVRLVVPDRILVDQSVDAVEVPSKSGDFEVLYGHAPLLAVIAPGVVRLHGGQAGERSFNVARGFVEVLPERVTILVESARPKEEIDVTDTQRRLDHAHQLWNEAGDDPEKYAHALELIREAEVRLEFAKDG